MTKVLFVNDGPRWKNEEGEYYGKNEDLFLINRYKYLGDTVSFLMRARIKKDTSNLMSFTENHAEFIEVPTFNRLRNIWKRIEAKKIIKNSVVLYDILIIRLPSTIGSIALKEARIHNIPFIVEVVGCPWDTLWNYNYLGKIYAPIAYIKLKKNVAFSPFVIYVTKEFLQKRYPTSGINENVSNVIIKTPAKEILNSKIERYSQIKNDTTIHLATLGAVDVPYKGQADVIKAIQILKKKGYDNIVYHIAGQGSDQRLKSLSIKLNVKEKIIFDGLLPHRNIPEFLENIDIYIQPSRTEGLPRALIEAMSIGCVCIGANVGGISELLPVSMLYSKKNIYKLVSILERLLVNKESLIEYSKLNLKTVKSYQFDVLDKKRKSFYNIFLNESNLKKNINHSRNN